MRLKSASDLLEAFGQPVWRVKLPPLDELVSTILSQNTNDVNRDRAFDSLRQVSLLGAGARCPARRCDRGHPDGGPGQSKGPAHPERTARDHRRGRLTRSALSSTEIETEDAREWLLRFKGVGPKTAAIVLLFSLDKPAFPVDTHITGLPAGSGFGPRR